MDQQHQENFTHSGDSVENASRRTSSSAPDPGSSPASPVDSPAARTYAPFPGSFPLLFATGFGLGILADALLNVSGPPGLNMSMLLLAVSLAGLCLHIQAGLQLDRHRLVWLSLAVLYGFGLTWRDAPPLRLLALASTAICFALAAYRRTANWVLRAGITEYLAGFLSTAFHTWTGAGLALFEATSRFPGGTQSWRGLGLLVGVARGLLIAMPLLVFFGALFVSADPVFESLLASLFHLDLERLASHLLLTLIFGWVVTGYLRGLLATTEPPALILLRRGELGFPLLGRRLKARASDVLIPLAFLNLLFLVFVLVQIRYLFGGDDLVQITRGLTYAKYARRGFAELLVAVMVVLPLLLAGDWLLDARDRAAKRWFRILAGAQVVLVLVIAASSFKRLSLYVASYGLTQARFYAAVLLAWLAAMLVWFMLTVLRDRRHRFGFGALAIGLASVALLFFVNPDAIIARTNIARLQAGTQDVPFDVSYATSLSADAVPVLLEALPVLPPEAQCQLARHLLRRWNPDHPSSIRNWNYSAAHARKLVRQSQAQLQFAVGPAGQCSASPGS